MFQISGARVEKAIGGLSDEMQASTAEVISVMGGLSSQIAQSHRGLSNELNAVKILTEAIAHGIGQLQLNMKQQTKVLLHVMEYCENIQAGQSAIIDNQVQIMNAIVSTRAEVVSGVDKILKVMQTQRMEATIEVFKVLTRQLEDHLKDPGKHCYLVLYC